MRLPAFPLVLVSGVLFSLSSLVYATATPGVYKGGIFNMYASESGAVNGGCGEYGRVATLADIKFMQQNQELFCQELPASQSGWRIRSDDGMKSLTVRSKTCAVSTGAAANSKALCLNLDTPPSGTVFAFQYEYYRQGTEPLSGQATILKLGQDLPVANFRSLRLPSDYSTAVYGYRQENAQGYPDIIFQSMAHIRDRYQSLQVRQAPAPAIDNGPFVNESKVYNIGWLNMYVGKPGDPKNGCGRLGRMVTVADIRHMEATVSNFCTNKSPEISTWQISADNGTSSYTFQGCQTMAVETPDAPVLCMNLDSPPSGIAYAFGGSLYSNGASMDGQALALGAGDEITNMTLKSFRMPVDESLTIYAYPEFDFKGRPVAFSKSIESLAGLYRSFQVFKTLAISQDMGADASAETPDKYPRRIPAAVSSSPF